MPDCLHPQRFQMDGPADGKARCALCELERVALDHAAGLNDAATLLLRADRAEREVARLTALVEKLQAERLDSLADNVAELDMQERAALRQPAPDPAQPDATMLSDNSLQTSSQTPAQGQE